VDDKSDESSQDSSSDSSASPVSTIRHASPPPSFPSPSRPASPTDSIYSLSLDDDVASQPVASSSSLSHIVPLVPTAGTSVSLRSPQFSLFQFAALAEDPDSVFFSAHGVAMVQLRASPPFFKGFWGLGKESIRYASSDKRWLAPLFNVPQADISLLHAAYPGHDFIYFRLI